ncbi:TraB/GumN family protein [Truepera radiovictrix]|uniref:TraB family protein n=1 Tax=Truepera radiovictrix (strain DSM 17093 / CIP 108686 / LMG 22925 / RQ-24) TaxID=649638 RepID=D7CQQ8_TRURR|nr:TraB/GumN family protein [Truepera radiovictrix]ADI15042.1 TraB family protein [Truepera radiovictrix DSM 17093]WMT56405.1 TraB/GumN family protein [Truepera radiovictrix]
MTVTPEPPLDTAQPLRDVTLKGVDFTLLGTAHVSRTSADEVERLIQTGDFDAVAVELDAGRFGAISDPDRWAKTDLFEVFREGKAAMMAASLALGAFQQRLAEQSGVEPGEEMRRAVRLARARGLPLLLIDRDLGVTLRRVYGNVPWWQRLVLIGGLLGSVLSRDEVTPEEVEKLKEGDVLEATFAEFAEDSAALFEPLIRERDRYMAARLREEVWRDGEPRFKRVLVVIGAGHLKGVAEHLAAPPATPPALERAALEALPKGTPWHKLLPWALVGLIVLGFAIGFSRDQALGWQLLREWVLINGGLSALGALVATAHPLTVLTSFVAAPLTSLNPLVGVGFVAAGVELWLRKPQMGDFAALRRDVTTARGWWRNRVARTLLVFFLATLGSVLGTYLAGFRILERLL